MPLVLKRRFGESVLITHASGDQLEVRITHAGGQHVRLSFCRDDEPPRRFCVNRDEAFAPRHHQPPGGSTMTETPPPTTPPAGPTTTNPQGTPLPPPGTYDPSQDDGPSQ